MVNKHYKDTLFCTIFHQKKDLLSLYNALNHTHYTDEEGIIITTLDGALYLGYRNDVSFLIQDTLLLYEHQSSMNPNMPLRGLFYFPNCIRLTSQNMNIISTALQLFPSRYRNFLYFTMELKKCQTTGAGIYQMHFSTRRHIPTGH